MKEFARFGLALRALVLFWLLAVIGISGCGGPSRAKRSTKPKAPSTSVKKALAEGKEHLASMNQKQAIAAFSKAIKLDPKCKDAYVWRGVAYKESNDRQKALADFTKAIQLDPTENYAYEQRAAIYEQINEPAKAMADKDKAFELRQKNRDDMRERLKGKKGKK